MLRSFRHWRLAERGFATAAMFIMSLPLIVGAFGFGFDYARAVYIKAYIQNRATMAVQTAVATNAITDVNGISTLDVASTETMVYTNYLMNTDSKRQDGTLRCSTGSVSGYPLDACTGIATVQGVPMSLADYCKKLSTPGFIPYGVHYEVSEVINTTFLKIIGIKQMTLHKISASALVRSGNCT
jgi:hypothetical protein